jgi:multisubunit Na+/H+ antiporter MnhE subunit
MLHAAAMLSGIFLLWLLLTQRWATPTDFAFAAAAALACVSAGLVLGGVRDTPFARAPQVLLLTLSRAGAVFSGALSTLRAALAADVSVKPALVRLKLQASAEAVRSAFSETISAAPGVVVVDSDADGVLAHVIDEDAVDAADLGVVEARVVSMYGGAR